MQEFSLFYCLQIFFLIFVKLFEMKQMNYRWFSKISSKLYNNVLVSKYLFCIFDRGKRKRSYSYDQLEDDFPLDFFREPKMNFASSRQDAMAYLRRLPERLLRLQENELENQDLQSDDIAKYEICLLYFCIFF